MCDCLLGLSMGDLRGNEDKNSCPSPSSAFQISSFLSSLQDSPVGKVLIRILYFRE